MAKLGSTAFAAFLEACAARGDGYIMGATGQDPKKLADWYYSQYSGAQKEKALYWKKNCERVWDCQGLAEGYLNGETGSNFNVRARDNYATWCDPKGAGAIPLLGVCWGVATVTSYSSDVGSIAITFPFEYDTVVGLPHVFAVGIIDAPKVLQQVTVDIPTATGCTIYVHRSTTTATSISWLAIGKPKV